MPPACDPRCWLDLVQRRPLGPESAAVDVSGFRLADAEGETHDCFHLKTAQNVENTAPVQFSSVQISRSVMSDSLRPHESLRL